MNCRATAPVAASVTTASEALALQILTKVVIAKSGVVKIRAESLPAEREDDVEAEIGAPLGDLAIESQGEFVEGLPIRIGENPRS
jgi:hypothetical protein